MDLGFGNTNQAIGNAAATQILRATEAQEAAIASEISRYDALLESNDTDLEKLREKRLAQLKSASQQKSKWLENGHGVYTDLPTGQHSGDIAKAFFDATKKSNRLVIHFHRPTTRQCDVFHAALEKLAPRHPETKFLRINVEGCDDVRESGSGVGAKYLVEKLGIVVMPTLLIVVDRKAHHQLRGFDELGGTTDFTVNELAFVLGGHGALTRKDDEEVEPSFISGESSGGGTRGIDGVNSLRMRFGGDYGGRGVRRGGYDEDFDEE